MEALTIDPCKSKGIQDSLRQVGEGNDFNTLFLKAGCYTIDDPGCRNPFSVLGINNGSKILGETDTNGNSLVTLKLMQDAPLNPFKCGFPIFGPTQSPGCNIEIGFLNFDGNNPPGKCLQGPATKATCPGTAAAAGSETGKGFHNFIGDFSAGLEDCSFHDIELKNTAGDGLRTNKTQRSSGLKIFNWDIDFCGHCGIFLENSEDCYIGGIKVTSRVDGGIRLNGCSDITIENADIRGTSANYDRGIYLSGDNLTARGCRVHNTMGPGIEFQGIDNTGMLIEECEVINCGSFAKTVDYGAAGILLNGVSGKIRRVYLNGNYQNSIAVNKYSPDGNVQFKKKDHKIDIEDCDIFDTQPSSFRKTGDGKHIANLMTDSHTVTSLKNRFWPAKNYSWEVQFLD